jgi:uncharacterized membrane protein YeaQ/YmgE (transglycosylase-associated protein family)
VHLPDAPPVCCEFAPRRYNWRTMALLYICILGGLSGWMYAKLAGEEGLQDKIPEIFLGIVSSIVVNAVVNIFRGHSLMYFDIFSSLYVVPGVLFCIGAIKVLRAGE